MKKNHIKGARFRESNPDIFWIASIDGGKTERFTIYSPQVWGVWTHFHNDLKITTPCYKNHKFCFNGHDPRSLRWKGYLFCHAEMRRRNEFLQLTEAGAKHLVDQMGPDVGLRGLTIDVQRTAKKQGRLYVSIASFIQRDPRTFPHDVNPRASLFNTWDQPDPGHEFAEFPDMGQAGAVLLG